jgi:hypothetical protein
MQCSTLHAKSPGQFSIGANTIHTLTSSLKTHLSGKGLLKCHR